MTAAEHRDGILISAWGPGRQDLSEVHPGVRGDLPPIGGVNPDLDRRAALAALAAAIFARGGLVVMPADPDFAVMVCTTSLMYAEPVATETGRRPRVLVIVQETQREDQSVRRLLAPFVARGSTRYLDRSGDDVRSGLAADIEPGQDRPDTGFDLARSRRQPLTRALLEDESVRYAYVIAPTQEAQTDLAMLTAQEIRFEIVAAPDDREGQPAPTPCLFAMQQGLDERPSDDPEPERA